MTPDQLAEYRAATANDTFTSLPQKTRVCPLCKKPRSLRQYEDGHKNCNKCRGIR